MGVISASQRIEAAPADVWAVITDLRSAPERISGITKIDVLSDGDFGVGTRWRETRIMFKRECTEEMWITAVDPERSYDVEARSCGCHYQTRIQLEPDGSGTILSMSMNTTPESFTAKLMMPLGILFKGALVKCIKTDLDDIRAAVAGPGRDAVPA